MISNEFERTLLWAKGYGRLQGTLKSIVSLIDAGMIQNLDTVVEFVESRLKKEENEPINKKENNE